ncbi:MAG: AAA family ATPase [Deltaproteobacteria bacterium]|nr:AAA family ATPase [Deltaproteobacteria bacterium]
MEEDLNAGEQAEREKHQRDKGKIYLPLTTKEESRVSIWLPEKPKDLIWTYDNVLLHKTVGAIAGGGGVGKTHFVLQLFLNSARGTQFSIFRPPRPLNVLLLCNEDQQEILGHRLWDMTKGNFPNNLYVQSLVGRCGPLMSYEGKQPVRTEYYYRLEETIKSFGDLDIICLDTKGRFCGLDENSNNDNGLWIVALEELCATYGTTILFNAHVPKTASQNNSSITIRGASATTDYVRWVMGISRMDAKQAAGYGINEKKFVVLDMVKTNYGEENEKQIILQRGEGGVLTPCDPATQHFFGMGKTLAELLQADGGLYTKNELRKGIHPVKEHKERIKNIQTEMEGRFPSGWKNSKMLTAIDAGLAFGCLRIINTRRDGSRQDVEVVQPIIDEILQPDGPGYSEPESSCSR